MKVIIIGDIHGRTTWKEVIKERADKYIFMGDYFDPYEDISIESMIENFEQILEFKKSNFENVILLIGNHDFHYLSGNKSSRFNYKTYNYLNPILEDLITSKTLQLCYFIKGGVVFSHAGFTETWLDNTFGDDKYVLNEDFIKSVKNKNYRNYDFIIKGYFQNLSGDDVFQGPLWVRPRSLIRDFPKSMNVQVIGHTKRIKYKENDDFSGEIILSDILEDNQYLIYENNKFNFKEL